MRKLYQRLRKDGFDPWLDEEELEPGQLWREEISKAVRKSDVVIVCLSRGSVNKAGFIQKEIKIALDVADEQPQGSIFIIPLKLEVCEVPERLSEWHWVNLYEKHGYGRLIKALKRRADAISIDQPRAQSADAPTEAGLSEGAGTDLHERRNEERHTARLIKLIKKMRISMSANSRRRSVYAAVFIFLVVALGASYALSVKYNIFYRRNAAEATNGVGSRNPNEAAPNANERELANLLSASNTHASDASGTNNQNTNEAPPQADKQEAAEPAATPTPPVALFPAIAVRVRAGNVANGWTDSGLMVRKGQRLRITARGRALVGGGNYATPAGLAQYHGRRSNLLMGSKPWGALIAVIGDDNDDFIFIGANADFVARRAGRLFLGLNDDDLNNNQGGYDAVVELLPDK